MPESKNYHIRSVIGHTYINPQHESLGKFGFELIEGKLLERKAINLGI